MPSSGINAIIRIVNLALIMLAFTSLYENTQRNKMFSCVIIVVNIIFGIGAMMDINMNIWVIKKPLLFGRWLFF